MGSALGFASERVLVRRESSTLTILHKWHRTSYLALSPSRQQRGMKGTIRNNMEPTHGSIHSSPLAHGFESQDSTILVKHLFSDLGFDGCSKSSLASAVAMDAYRERRINAAYGDVREKVLSQEKS